jgi:hypothetical protein
MPGTNLVLLREVKTMSGVVVICRRGGESGRTLAVGKHVGEVSGYNEVVLVLREVTKTDAGLYTCQAENGVGTHMPTEPWPEVQPFNTPV